jgi:hypothetical protein
VRTPRPADLRRFCVVDGWERVADSPGRRVAKHEVWTKRLPDGRVLHTAISKGRDEYGVSLFTRLLKSQIQVTAAQFWLAVDNGEPPQRPGAKSARPRGEALPFAVAERLLAAGLPLSELAGLSQAEAERRLDDLERGGP